MTSSALHSAADFVERKSDAPTFSNLRRQEIAHTAIPPEARGRKPFHNSDFMS